MSDNFNLPTEAELRSMSGDELISFIADGADFLPDDEETVSRLNEIAGKYIPQLQQGESFEVTPDEREFLVRAAVSEERQFEEAVSS